ncbi:helix-turn-helix domain-containing protein [Paenibacillus alvei]|uniref:helix-turn-helix domain-containing protein n=1 Tax=Paenibacillus alvei TaxID=44250 RepID=UPI0002899200|nr:helix-turn-helix transcriptional regulator [Paenibacillus alvei]EJW14087.1 hypothetical protein PAV_141p01930 [Paenibacillus alvei DSM 29]MCY9545043.1 helix-turn-helix domain-containing protein [Paenibacillus alvei]MCY9707763.1 helix-turn-helix domain-containing protein [Paenibacillus alvei]MCY9757744.1 helix-turn-helix domain-containing protein [Paenibacillus alvei]MEC0082724.1 helix-turn-helix transcriptional regulator [Paenibacillus alvei]
MQNDNRIIFGELINKRRKELKLTLKSISSFCGVSVNFISLVERGQKSPRDEVILKLAQILKLDEDLLFKTLDKIHPSVQSNVKNVINEHDGFKELLGELYKKVKDEKMREELYEEVYSVYTDFLKRNNLE